MCNCLRMYIWDWICINEVKYMCIWYSTYNTYFDAKLYYVNVLCSMMWYLVLANYCKVHIYVVSVYCIDFSNLYIQEYGLAWKRFNVESWYVVRWHCIAQQPYNIRSIIFFWWPVTPSALHRGCWIHPNDYVFVAFKCMYIFPLWNNKQGGGTFW